MCLTIWKCDRKLIEAHGFQILRVDLLTPPILDAGAFARQPLTLAKRGFR